MTHNAITVTDACIYYGHKKVVSDICATFVEGSLTAIAGPNGAGKSTLLKAIAGIISPRSGRIDIDPCFKNAVAYLPQSSSMQRDFPITVLEAVVTGLWKRSGETIALDKASKQIAYDAIKKVGLDGFENRHLTELSGGQFQRVQFARLIAEDARIILLDEPFAAVDAATTSKLMEIILDWNRDGRTVICVLHDLLLIKKYFPESFVLSGSCMGRGHTHELFEKKLLSYDLDMANLGTGIDNTAKLHKHDHN